MIVPMTKYELVLYHGSYERFLEDLRELGLVDITTTGWEPGEADRAMIATIEQYRQAIAKLEQVAENEKFTPVKPFETGEDTFMEYRRISSAIDAASAQIVKLRKEAEDAKVWGEFDPAKMEELLARGVEMRFFAAYDSDFAANSGQWAEQYLIEEVARKDGMTYFALITRPLEEISISAQEVRLPASDYAEKEREADKLTEHFDYLCDELGRCASSIHLLKDDLQELSEKLSFHRVRGSAACDTEGVLMVFEGWAPRENEAKVDAFIESQPDLVYVKSKPTPEDDTPVLLKNNRYASLFELIGGFYSLPKYGTMDLTPYFAPFYMIFFGFCLCDGGYGLLLLLTGLVLKIKGVKGIVNQVAGLTIWLGAATIVFGILTGGFFGVDIYSLGPLKDFSVYKLESMDLFILALGFGVVQILFGMLLKVIATTQQLGFKYALGTIGWMITLSATLAAVVLPQAGIEGFSMSSPVYLALAGIGVFMMLFLNSPGKNPLVNFGAGLWNTYNDVSGFVGDFLSYIRLFAIGLSGGILALVFNDLAFGLAPDIPVVKQLTVLFILLFGHGINIFMSCLSAFVHPLRLTFVEFYKNAGFEPTQRAFNPFRKNSND